jgi:hypothetical protein
MKFQRSVLIFLFVIIVWICKPIPYDDVVRNRNQFVREEVLVLRGGKRDSTDRIHVGRKILLKNLFPDWPERVAYQKEQEKFYKSAQAKLQEAKKLRISEKSLFLTVQERDALNYFNGTSFYEEHQNPKTLPNIFDTRQSFLLKMESHFVRTNFLNSYNWKYKK